MKQFVEGFAKSLVKPDFERDFPDLGFGDHGEKNLIERPVQGQINRVELEQLANMAFFQVTERGHRLKGGELLEMWFTEGRHLLCANTQIKHGILRVG